MLSNDLRRWQQEKRYRVGGDAVYGVYSNVGFSVVEEDGGKLFVFMLSGNDEAYDRIEDMLGNQGGSLGEVQVGDVENYLALFFDESNGAMSVPAMDELLEFVSGNYRSCGFKAPNVCVKCGAPANKRSFVNNMVQPMCAQCREAEKMSKAQKSAAPAARNPYDEPPARRGAYPPPRDMGRYDDNAYNAYGAYDNYDSRCAEENTESGEGSAPSGFFGALLGVLAGMTPYFASVLLGFEIAALSCLGGIGAAAGYVAFGGLKRKKDGVTTIIAVAEIIALLSVLLVCGAANMSGGFSAMLNDLFSLSWFNMLMAGIGALLGVLVSLDRVYEYISPVSGKKKR